MADKKFVYNDMLTSTQRTFEQESAMLEHYISRVDFNSAYHEELRQLYEVAVGLFDNKNIKYLENPTNTSNADFTRTPATLRNYDIIGPVIDLYLGDNYKRPLAGTVIASSASAVNRYNDEKSKRLKNMIDQHFINSMNEAGIDTGMESKPLPPYDEAEKEFELTYTDKVAAVGQDALNILQQELNIPDKLQLFIYDWLVSGSIASYKSIIGENVNYECWDPRSLYVFGCPDGGLYEDAKAAVRMVRISKSDLVYMFGGGLDKKIPNNDSNLTYLEYINNYNQTIGATIMESTVNMKTEMFDGAYTDPSVVLNSEEIICYYVCYKTLKKVGVLDYFSPDTGEIESMEVDDTYKLDKAKGDVSIEWGWINCWRHGWKIGDVFYGLEEGVVQRSAKGNPSDIKLPVNGRHRNYRVDSIKSVVKTGLVFQELYNAVHFRCEFLLAKAKDKLTAFPVGLIPKKHGWTDDKWFYWSFVHGFLMYDESAPNAAAAIQGIKSIDLGLGNYIDGMWKLLSEIKTEWWDTIGMNRQRFGDTYASDGKGNVEQAIYRSAVISAEMFRAYDTVIEADYQGLIDHTPVAWINGKRGMYLTPDNLVAIAEIEGIDFLYEDLLVFCRNSRAEMEKVEQARQLAQVAGQNWLKGPALFDIIDANSMSKIREYASRALEMERKYELQKQDADRQQALQIQKMKSDDIQRKSEDTRYVADKGYAADIETALINSEASLGSFYADTINKNRELMEQLGTNTMAKIDQRYAEIKSSLDRERMNLDKFKINADLIKSARAVDIAKQNRNKYDKAPQKG